MLYENRCRWEDSNHYICESIVTEYIHLAYCSKHISTPQAIQNILKRQYILRDQNLIQNLREIIASYI